MRSFQSIVLDEEAYHDDLLRQVEGLITEAVQAEPSRPPAEIRGRYAEQKRRTMAEAVSRADSCAHLVARIFDESTFPHLDYARKAILPVWSPEDKPGMFSAAVLLLRLDGREAKVALRLRDDLVLAESPAASRSLPPYAEPEADKLVRALKGARRIDFPACPQRTVDPIAVAEFVRYLAARTGRIWTPRAQNGEGFRIAYTFTTPRSRRESSDPICHLEIDHFGERPEGALKVFSRVTGGSGVVGHEQSDVLDARGLLHPGALLPFPSGVSDTERLLRLVAEQLNATRGIDVVRIDRVAEMVTGTHAKDAGPSEIDRLPLGIGVTYARRRNRIEASLLPWAVSQH